MDGWEKMTTRLDRMSLVYKYDRVVGNFLGAC